MKIIGLSILSLVAIGCIDGNSNLKETITHSNAECPLNLAGTYESFEMIQNKQVQNVKVVSFEKNSQGVFELVDGADSGAQIIKVDGNAHSFDYQNENNETKTANYTAKCSKDQVHLNISSDEGKLSGVIFVDAEGNFVSTGTATVNGKTITDSTKMNRMQTPEPMAAAANECPLLEGEYVNVETGEHQTVYQDGQKTSFSSKPFDFIADGLEHSFGYLKWTTSCEAGEMLISGSLKAEGLDNASELRIVETDMGFKITNTKSPTGEQTIEIWEKK